MFVAGKWREDSQSFLTNDPRGGFVRPTSAFRTWLTASGEPGATGRWGFPVVPLGLDPRALGFSQTAEGVSPNRPSVVQIAATIANVDLSKMTTT